MEDKFKVDEKKVEKVLTKIQKILNRNKLNVPELLIAYGNLGYHIGAAMAQVQGEQGPSSEELQKAYYTNPTVDVALMIQGLIITGMAEDWEKKPQLSNLGEKER